MIKVVHLSIKKNRQTDLKKKKSLEAEISHKSSNFQIKKLKIDLKASKALIDCAADKFYIESYRVTSYRVYNCDSEPFYSWNRSNRERENNVTYIVMYNRF